MQRQDNYAPYYAWTNSVLSHNSIIFKFYGFQKCSIILWLFVAPMWLPVTFCAFMLHWKLSMLQLLSDRQAICCTALAAGLWHNFSHAMLCKHGLCHHMFIHSVKMNKHIFNIISPSGSHTILVFQYQTGWQYSDGNPPNGGVECRLGRQKWQFWDNIWLNCLLLMLQQARCCQHSRQ